MNETIYVVSHKDTWHSANPKYQLLQVGSATSSQRLDALHDDSGISISKKNQHYCELTGLYWIWKNDQASDVVGLCHYRRYFAFQKDHNQFLAEIQVASDNTDEIEALINPLGIEGYLELYDVLLPVPAYLNESIGEQYCIIHRQTDWAVLQSVIAELYPDYISSMDKVFHRKSLYAYNMFVMKKAKFDCYMEWLFPILEKVESQIYVSADSYQTRIFGFMAERLLNLYVYHCQFRIKELPIVFIKEDQQPTQVQHKRVLQLINEQLRKLHR